MEFTQPSNISTQPIQTNQNNQNGQVFTPQFAQSYNPAEDDEDESDEVGVGRKKSKGPGRRRIEIEYITDKSRRHITFSKRKAGIMKKAYELSVLTGTEVLLLIVSESGLVYTYSTNKLQPMVVEKEGKDLIQRCLTGWVDTPTPLTDSIPSNKSQSLSPALSTPRSQPKSTPPQSNPPSHHSQPPHQQQSSQNQNQNQNIPIPMDELSATPTQIDPRLTSYRGSAGSIDYPPVPLAVGVGLPNDDYSNYLTEPHGGVEVNGHSLRSSPRKRKNDDLGIDYPEAKRLAT